jgi:hypothetical protein
MIPLIEKYPFKKFWDAFMRQSRYSSHWDEKRTDQDVFIRRTLGKWFEGKYFQVIFDEYIPGDPFPLTRTEPYRFVHTKYVLIVNIRFGYTAYFDQIVIRFVEPHSTKLQEIWIKSSDWYNLSIEEDKESFTILRRFYPIEKKEIKLPQLLTSK